MRNDVSTFVDELNHEYEERHTRKEDAFWSAYMGLTQDADAAQKRLESAEIDLQRWLRDDTRRREVHETLEAVENGDRTVSEDDLVALRGWARTLDAHSIPSEDGQSLAESIIEEEGKLARARSTMELGYTLDGEFQAASSVKLGLLVRNGADEKTRKAAWIGLRSIEDHVLAHGFIDVVKKRNALGKMMGGEDFYDWTVKRVEGLTKREVFEVLDELEALTRERAEETVESLRDAHGATVTPWNINYLISGDVTAEQDPYFPFSRAVEVWTRSFSALGIRYHGAEMVLDLVDRRGKYENGFMHGPVCGWRDRGERKPARIQFTANAVPGQVGSGHRALQTLLHEGGHAAHFANIDMPSPCFAQEFAPTSVAFAETQSMFLDSLLDDPDWQVRYARSEAGEPMPRELIDRAIRMRQPAAAWQLRAMMVVPYAERAIYELPNEELTPETILATIRDVERRFLFLDEGSPRPVLSVPHLLAGESSAYYHGYVLAEVAVHQTRDFFLDRDGHLVDNPKIGPTLEEAYWRRGNAKTFKQFIRDLTGEELSARYLARSVNRSVDEALAEAEERISRLSTVPEPKAEVDLHASIRIMHGNEEVASSRESYGSLAREFAEWISELEATA